MKDYTKKRVIDNTWNYEGSNTKEYTHCFHAYPAMMIPQVARRILYDYKPKKLNYLFDPYCGTGTSLVESLLFGVHSIGTDLNPLARLITKAKTSILDINKVIIERDKINDELFKSNFVKEKHNFDIPNFPNLNFWFKEEIIEKLAFLRGLIYLIDDEHIRNFFLVAFSETIRKSSFTRDSEFKLFKMSQKNIDAFKVDPFADFLNRCERNIKGLNNFLKEVKVNFSADIYDFNTCNEIPVNLFPEGIDMILTSPPYGDSRTTVAYGQFSRLSNQWLGIDDANLIDAKLMGGAKISTEKYVDIVSAKKEMDEIKGIDEKRFNDVMSFFYDYKSSIDKISPLINKGGRVCYVVGNRTVKKVNIPLDIITAEFFCANGFKHLNTIIRKIPSKRMPSKNSPTNEAGKLVSTMNNEFIVILEKI